MARERLRHLHPIGAEFIGRLGGPEPQEREQRDGRRGPVLDGVAPVGERPGRLQVRADPRRRDLVGRGFELVPDDDPVPGQRRSHQGVLAHNKLISSRTVGEMGAMSQDDHPPGGQPLAIVGMACRLPGGVTNHEALWRLVRDGVDAITEIPAERFDTSGLNVRRAGLVDQFADFDPAPFGLSPREVVGMDPQQRWLLQLAWEALEDAGIAPDSLVGARAAVFVGISSIEFLDRLREESSAHVYEVMGGSMSAAAGRVSFTFGLEGPSVCVATACSSALVATHLAVQSLRRGESDLALVGGVQAILSRRILAIMSHMNMLSPRAQCRAFDASADGYARGEGGGVLAIKRLADAMNAGDPIWAVIRGSAMNQDGRSPGLTVPRGATQE